MEESVTGKQWEREITEAIPLSRRDGIGFEAQAESLTLRKSLDGSSTIKKREGSNLWTDPDRLVHVGVEHVEILFCDFNFVSKIWSKSSAENKFREGGVDLKKVKGVWKNHFGKLEYELKKKIMENN